MFKVEGRSLDNENITMEVSARTAKDIWNDPKKHGFTKIYKVTPMSNSRSRKQERELKYT